MMERGERYTAFDDALLRHSLVNVAAWNTQDFEAPDPIAFADYRANTHELIADLLTGPRVDPVYGFPCNDAGKLRQLSVISCPDLVRYSAAAVRVASTTNARLHDGVYATRLVTGPPRWKVHKGPARWPKFRDTAINLLSSGQCAVMRKEDVANFFPLVGIEVLDHVLSSFHCERRAVLFVRRLLTRWAGDSGLRGLPIGPDASRLLATALLLPADIAVEPFGGVHHLRWMDDNLYLGSELGTCGEAAAAANAALLPLGLGFGVNKSLSFGDADEAIAYLDENFVASLRVIAQAFRGTTHRDVFLTRLESAIEELDALPMAERCARPFRFTLHRLAENGSRFAAPLLASNPDLANVDPLTTGNYLHSVGSIRASARDDLLHQLEERHAGSDTFDALDLHLLRVAADGRLGRLGHSEGRLFEHIATDPGRRPPVRAWAWKAWGRSASWHERRAAEAAAAEQDQHVRRGALIPFRRGRGPSTHGRLIARHLRERHADVKYTARWVEAA